MTTAATFNTPARIIANAMENAALLAEGETPTSEQYAKYLLRLNDLINYLVTFGLKLWTQVDTAIPLTAGKATYTIGPTGDVVQPKPLRVLQGYYLDSSAIQRPIFPISREEYMRLATTTQQGAITQFFVDKQQNQLAVSFWLVPDAQAATGSVHLLLQNQITNPISLSESLNFTNESFLALQWLLADQISTGQPAGVVQKCAAMAQMYKAQMEEWDVEDASTTFQIDVRGSYASGGFR